MRKILLLAFLIFLGSGFANSQQLADSVKIYFQQGKSDLVLDFSGNEASLRRITDSLKTNYSDSHYRYWIEKVVITGAASPEGSISLNRNLSQRRAQQLFDYLSQYNTIPDSMMITNFVGRDWRGLVRLVEKDGNVPYRQETLDLLRQIASQRSSANSSTDELHLIQQLRGGVPYKYMYQNIFPELRASKMNITFLQAEKLASITSASIEVVEQEMAAPTPVYIAPVIYVAPEPEPECRPFYMALKTNMLYDAALVPNIGIEFYLGRQWSIAGNWMYAWWDNNRKHNYWRIYGGELELRRYFGRRAAEKPLTGHHVGLYGQALTYDFELGGRGYMGGKPGGNIFDKASYAAGISYGYALPVAKRLNIDFTIGIGYLGGEYREYIPIDDCYVWQTTKQRHWIGPTKAEIALVWLIGCDNFNQKKGGKW